MFCNFFIRQQQLQPRTSGEFFLFEKQAKKQKIKCCRFYLMYSCKIWPKKVQDESNLQNCCVEISKQWPCRVGSLPLMRLSITCELKHGISKAHYGAQIPKTCQSAYSRAVSCNFILQIAQFASKAAEQKWRPIFVSL